MLSFRCGVRQRWAVRLLDVNQMRHAVLACVVLGLTMAGGACRNLTLPLFARGAFLTLPFEWGSPPPQGQRQLVLDTGSSDIALTGTKAEVQAAVGNITVENTRAGVSHGLIVDDTILQWRSTFRVDGEDLPSYLILGARASWPGGYVAAQGGYAPPSPQLNATLAPVLVAPDFDVEGSAPYFSGWRHTKGVVGVLPSFRHLGSKSSLAALQGFAGQGGNATTLRYLSLHLGRHCVDAFGAGVSACRGAAPNSSALGTPPTGSLPAGSSGQVGWFTISSTMYGALAPLLADGSSAPLHWLDTPAESPTGLYAAELHEPAMCGVRLLGGITSSTMALVDTGAACLTLPAEAFDTMRTWAGDVLQCPTSTQGAPAWTMSSGSTARMCKLAPGADAAALPTISFAVSAAPGAAELHLPLASLVLSPADMNETQAGGDRWLCVRRQYSAALLKRTDSGGTASFVFGAMVLRAFSMVLDARTLRVAVQQQPSSLNTSTWEARPVAFEDGVQQTSTLLPRTCRWPVRCVGEAVWDASSNTCVAPAACGAAYATLRWDSARQQCTTWTQPVVVVILFILVLLSAEAAIARVLAAVHELTARLADGHGGSGAFVDRMDAVFQAHSPLSLRAALAMLRLASPSATRASVPSSARVGDAAAEGAVEEDAAPGSAAAFGEMPLLLRMRGAHSRRAAGRS